jgi:hypothetical protein
MLAGKGQRRRAAVPGRDQEHEEVLVKPSDELSLRLRGRTVDLELPGQRLPELGGERSDDLFRG